MDLKIATTIQKANIKVLVRAGYQTSGNAVLCVTSRPPSQLNVSIVVKLFNRFNIVSKLKQIKPNLRVKLLTTKISVIINHAWMMIFGSLSYLQEYHRLLNYG